MVKLRITQYETAPPKVTAATRAKTNIPGWHVRLEYGHRVGYGEAYLWPGFGSTRELINSDFEHSERVLSDLATPEAVCTWLTTRTPITSPSQYALELACLDLLGKHNQSTVASILWERPVNAVPCHTTLDGWSELQSPEIWGSRTLKIKVGKLEPKDEHTYISAVLSRHPTIRLRLDANGAWNFDHARRICELTERYPNVIIEQPLPADNFDALSKLQAQTKTVIALDESFVLSPDQSITTGCSQIVVKPMYAGGLLASKQACERIKLANRSICVTHALEGPVGRAGAQHFAAGIPTTGAHGVGNDNSVGYVKLKNAHGHGAVQ